MKKRRERLSGMSLSFLFFSYTFHPERLLEYESSSRQSVLDKGRRMEEGDMTGQVTRSCASASAKRQDDNYSRLPKSHWTTRAITKKELPKSIYRNIRVKNVKKRGGGRKMRKRGGDRGCWLMRVIRYPARDTSWWCSRDRIRQGRDEGSVGVLVVREEESLVLVPVMVDIGTDVEIIAYAYAFIDNNSHFP